MTQPGGNWKSTGRIDHREQKETKEERKRTCLPYRYYVNVTDTENKDLDTKGRGKGGWDELGDWN